MKTLDLEFAAKLVRKGGYGDWVAAYNPDGKCEWYTFNRKTLEVYAREASLMLAQRRAVDAHHNAKWDDK